MYIVIASWRFKYCFRSLDHLPCLSLSFNLSFLALHYRFFTWAVIIITITATSCIFSFSIVYHQLVYFISTAHRLCCILYEQRKLPSILCFCWRFAGPLSCLFIPFTYSWLLTSYNPFDVMQHPYHFGIVVIRADCPTIRMISIVHYRHCMSVVDCYTPLYILDNIIPSTWRLALNLPSSSLSFTLGAYHLSLCHQARSIAL